MVLYAVSAELLEIPLRGSGKYIWWNAGVGLSGALTGTLMATDASVGGQDAGSSIFPPAVGDGKPGLGEEMCFIEKFVRGPLSRGLLDVATLASGAGCNEVKLFRGEEGVRDVRAVENFEEGIGEEGFGK